MQEHSAIIRKIIKTARPIPDPSLVKTFSQVGEPYVQSHFEFQKLLDKNRKPSLTS